MGEFTGALRSDSAQAFGGVEEVATMLGVERRHVFTMMREGRIVPIRNIDVHPRPDGSYVQVPLFHLEQVREQFHGDDV